MKIITISYVFIVPVYDKSQWTHLHQVIYYNASYTQIMSTQDYASYSHMRDMCSSHRFDRVYILYVFPVTPNHLSSWIYAANEALPASNS